MQQPPRVRILCEARRRIGPLANLCLRIGRLPGELESSGAQRSLPAPIARFGTNVEVGAPVGWMQTMNLAVRDAGSVLAKRSALRLGPDEG